MFVLLTLDFLLASDFRYFAFSELSLNQYSLRFVLFAVDFLMDIPVNSFNFLIGFPQSILLCLNPFCLSPFFVCLFVVFCFFPLSKIQPCHSLMILPPHEVNRIRGRSWTFKMTFQSTLNVVIPACKTNSTQVPWENSKPKLLRMS